MDHISLFSKLIHYKVGKISAETYLFGTMHSASDEALSFEAFMRPYILLAKNYFGETNEEGMKSAPQISFDIPNWKGIRQLMGNNAFIKSDRILSKNYNLHIERLEHLPPLMINAIISEYLMNASENRLILDQALWKYANAKGLNMGGIESAREQYEIFSKIPLTYQTHQLKELLKNISTATKKLKSLARAYGANDLNSIHRLSKKSLGTVRQILLYDRNKVMADRIYDIVLNNETNFVTIGAAHLPGKTGVLRLLKQKGIKIVPIDLQINK